MDFRKSSKGITLIALVITIIVLLILAGVSLSLVAGGDGILGKAESGTKEYRIASARELLDLKLSEIDMDSYENNLRKANFAEIVEKLADDNDFVIVGTELGQVSSLNKDVSLPDDLNSLKAILVCSTSYTDVIFRISNEREITLWGEDVEVEVPEVQKYTVTYNANGGTGQVPEVKKYEKNTEVTINFPTMTKEGYKFLGWSTASDATEAIYTTEVSTLKITENVILYAVWEKERQTLASKITTANYGDYVDLGTSLIVNDNIALEDGTYPTTDWRIFHKDSTGGVYLILADYLPYSYETTVGSGLSQCDTLYPYNWISDYSREDLITRLEDTSAWNKLLSSIYTEKGISVKGAVDLETWVASWNAKEYTKLYIAETSGGYYIGTSENPTTTYIYLSSSTNTGYGDALYFPHKNYTSRSDAYGYWLASLAMSNAYDALYINYQGGVFYDLYDDDNGSPRSVRPAVYIPAGINAEKNAEGVWEIK